MIPAILLSALGVGIPKWLTGPLKWVVDAAIIVALLGGIYLLIHHSGVKAGEAKITAKVEQQHTARVAEARTDEQHAQVVTDRIGDRVTRADDATTDLLRQKLEEMNNELAALKSAPAGAPAPVLDVDGVSASLNAVVDRANRAAQAADAIGGADANGASVAP